MTVIMTTREMGSRGPPVAVGVAAELGTKSVWHKLAEHVTGPMHPRESAIRHLHESIDRLVEHWGAGRGELTLFTREEITKRADDGSGLILRLGYDPSIQGSVERDYRAGTTDLGS
jgi:hypothetical protein